VEHIPGLITVRTSSTRLPQKCLLPFGQGNVIEHIIHRSRHYGLRPILCTSDDSADDVLEEIATRHDVECFRGSLNNKVRRWRDCCDRFGIDAMHTIDADDPFFDGDQMKESFASLTRERCEIVYPTRSSSGGGGSVGYSLSRGVLEKACALTWDDQDTEMAWSVFERIPSLKTTRLSDLPDWEPLQIRLTLDYWEDYWLLDTVRRLVGNLATRGQVEALFRRNPDLHAVNWFRNEQWKLAQRRKEAQT